MAAPQAQQVWRKVVDEPIEVVEDNGDVYAPLKRVRDQYYARAQRTLARATDEETGQLCDPAWGPVIEGMRLNGDRVNALIPQETVDAEPITGSESSDSGDGAGPATV